MDNPIRLHSISPDLSDLFQSVDERRQRRAVKAACLGAVKQTGLHDADVDHAIEALDSKTADLENIQQRFTALSESLDAEYFDLRESNPCDVEALARFRQARAASALAFGLSPHRDHLSEAVYEAIIAAVRRSDIINEVELALTEHSNRAP